MPFAKYSPYVVGRPETGLYMKNVFQRKFESRMPTVKTSIAENGVSLPACGLRKSVIIDAATKR